MIFLSIAKDVFSSATDLTNITASKDEQEFEGMFTKLITEKGLVAHAPWVSNAMQLFQLSNVYHGNSSYATF